MLGLFTLLCGTVFILNRLSNAAEKSKKGWLGVRIEEITPSLRDELKLGDRFGLLVVDVVNYSPADDAGLREDDVIIKYDDRDVEKADEFSKMVRKTEPGTAVKLLIVRDGAEKEIEVTIERRKIERHKTFGWRGEDFEVILSRPQLGVRVHELNEDLAEYFQVEKNAGVLVSEVIADGPAEDAGLKAGDVITKIDDEDIADPDELIDVLNDYEDGDTVTVEFVRKGKTESVDVELAGADFFHHFFGRGGKHVVRMPPWHRNRWRGPKILFKEQGDSI